MNDYKNYLKQCPNCGAQLSEHDTQCPFCDINLVGLNSEANQKHLQQKYDSKQMFKTHELNEIIDQKLEFLRNNKYYQKIRISALIKAIMIPIIIIQLFNIWVLVDLYF